MLLSEMIAWKLRSIRNSRGLTQEKLAELSGITDRTISTIETGRHEPSLETIEKLIIALDVSPREFFDFDWQGKTDEARFERLTKITDGARTLTDEGLSLTAQFVEMMASYEAKRSTPKKREKK